VAITFINIATSTILALSSTASALNLLNNRAAVGGNGADTHKCTADMLYLDSPPAFPDPYAIGQDISGIGIDDCQGRADGRLSLEMKLFVTAVIFHFPDSKQASFGAGFDDIIAGAVAVFIDAIAGYFSSPGIDLLRLSTVLRRHCCPDWHSSSRTPGTTP